MAKKKAKKLRDQEPYGIHLRLSKKALKRNKKKKLQPKNVHSEHPGGPSSLSKVDPLVTSVATSTPSITTHGNEVVEGRKKEKESAERTSGFIFMCNRRTKPECYRNRVFGLPAGQLNVVEKIKLGAKLFLFDFDLKLLYGVYKATSKGELGLEPTAFNGRYPAQVRFEIYKECLPLPENAFRHILKDNYRGSKFRQDLNSKQVKSLVALFRPLTEPTYAATAPKLTNVVYPNVFPAPANNGWFQLPTSRPPPDDSYLQGVRHIQPLPVRPVQSEPMSPGLSANQYRPPTYMRHVQPAMEPQHRVDQAAQPHRSVPYYTPEAHQPYVPENPALPAESSCKRYGQASGVVQRDQITTYQNQYYNPHLPIKRDIIQHSQNVTDYYGQNLAPAAAPHAPLQRQTHSGNISVSYQSYYPPAVNENPHQGYASGPLQSPVIASLQVSSHYALAGAPPSYR